MNKQTWTWIILVIVVVGIIWMVTGRTDESLDVDEELNISDTTEGEADVTAEDTTPTTKPATQTSTKTTTKTTTSPKTTTTTPQPLLYQVKYLESGGYLPITTKIKVGDVVSFVNVGTNKMWTISDDYIGHGTNNCGTASEYLIFDQCRVGNSYSFKMNVRGVWTYYNKEALHHKGTIIVE